MEHELSPGWKAVLAQLDYAFQPIALFADGRAFGFEALLRGWDKAGFASIADLFDAAHIEACLYPLDLELRRLAFRKFAAADLGAAKLFFNIDNRLLQIPGYAIEGTLALAEKAGLAVSRIVFELTELHEPNGGSDFEGVISAYRRLGFRIALDDFGSGYAGLKLLLRAEPDIVKIDRYFVGGVADDPRKASFLSKVVGMAHLMGITVVARPASSRSSTASARIQAPRSYQLLIPRAAP